jgi:predicted membrane-bound spermidine synthase
LLKSVLLASSLNAIVAAALIWKKRTTALCVCLLVVLVFLSGLWASTEDIQHTMDMAFVQSTVHSNQSTKWTITHSMNTPYQKVIIGEQSWPVPGGEHVNHFMTLDGEVQYDGRYERQYHEAFVHPLLCRVTNLSSILVVGGGDGMLIRELVKYDSVRHVDHIDIDEELVRLFKTDPELLALNDRALLDPKVRTMYADGLAYLRTSTVHYDVVFFDLPSPVQEKVAKFYTQEVSRLVMRRLKPRGFFITHTSPNHARYQAPSLRAGGFKHVVNYRQGYVGYLIATNHDMQAADVSPISLCAGMTQAFLPGTMYNTFANNTLQLEEAEATSIYRPNPSLLRMGYGVYTQMPKLVDNPLMA